MVRYYIKRDQLPKNNLNSSTGRQMATVNENQDDTNCTPTKAERLVNGLASQSRLNDSYLTNDSKEDSAQGS